jgi:DNA/RNA-binding domain of Phe-tRNA-synthetase-like protein
LLRRLAKQGDIPSISTLVDIGNLVSIRYAVPVAVFDRAGVARSITVRFATGDERFTDLGSSESVTPDPGEVVFVDEDGVVCARRWCWRQSAQSATNPRTVEALVVIEGHHDAADRDIEAAVADLTALLSAHQPESQIESRALSPTDPDPEHVSGHPTRVEEGVEPWTSEAGTAWRDSR